MYHYFPLSVAIIVHFRSTCFNVILGRNQHCMSIHLDARISVDRIITMQPWLLNYVRSRSGFGICKAPLAGLSPEFRVLWRPTRWMNFQTTHLSDKLPLFSMAPFVLRPTPSRNSGREPGCTQIRIRYLPSSVLEKEFYEMASILNSVQNAGLTNLPTIIAGSTFPER